MNYKIVVTYREVSLTNKGHMQKQYGYIGLEKYTYYESTDSYDYSEYIEYNTTYDDVCRKYKDEYSGVCLYERYPSLTEHLYEYSIYELDEDENETYIDYGCEKVDYIAISNMYKANLYCRVITKNGKYRLPLTHLCDCGENVYATAPMLLRDGLIQSEYDCVEEYCLSELEDVDVINVSDGVYLQLFYSIYEYDEYENYWYSTSTDIEQPVNIVGEL